MTWLFAVIIVGVSILALTAWFAWTRGPHLSAQSQKNLLQLWQKSTAQRDVHRQVLDADTVIAKLLDELGFTGSMGEKLQKARRYLPDLNGVWAAHKLRNRIAHEPGVTVSEYDGKRALASFEKIIRKFCF